ncbi:MAG TPA: inorganic phosphate transporter [Halanaerobiales bacterium]|nr:inorganic phosphate transporter [Halanaerobiales bacterium]
MFKLISGFFLGWALGSNDAANIFGTAVATRTIRFWTAAILTSIFVIVGAVLEGSGGMHTLGSLSSQTVNSAFITSLAAAITVSLMTYLKLPVSTSQAVVGAIIGSGIVRNTVNFRPLLKIFSAWIFTPIGALIIAIIFMKIYSKYIENYINNIIKLDRIVKIGLVIAGIYGSYALGANNVANVTGVYVKTGLVSPLQGALIGGIAIASGVLTYSRSVMMTVGKKITELSSLNALIAVLAESTTVYIYARIGIPVSTSQAIVGAVIGIGLIKGINLINKNTLKNILFGWLGTPTIALIISFIFTKFIN